MVDEVYRIACTKIKDLQIDLDGLSSNEAHHKMKIYGPNEIAQERPSPWYIQLIKSFINPFNIILMALATLSFIMDVVIAHPSEESWEAVIIISTMIILSGLLRFTQEYRSNRAAEQLKAMVKTTATVLRSDLGIKEIEMSQIVPGDIILLSAGDMIPADVRIINAKDLFVSQSALTHNEDYYESNAGFTDARFSIGLPIKISEKFLLTPNLHYSTLLDKSIRKAVMANEQKADNLFFSVLTSVQY